MKLRGHLVKGNCASTERMKQELPFSEDGMNHSGIKGLQTVDYTEADDAISQFGRIGLQVDGGGKTEAWYEDITIEELR